MSELVNVAPSLPGKVGEVYRFVSRQAVFTDDDGSVTVFFDTQKRPHMIRAWIYDRTGGELLKSFETQSAGIQGWRSPGIDGFYTGVWQLHWNGRNDVGEPRAAGTRVVEIAVYVRPDYVPRGVVTSDISVIKTVFSDIDPATALVNGLLQVDPDTPEGSGPDESSNLPGGASKGLIFAVVAVVAGGVVLSMRGD